MLLGILQTDSVREEFQPEFGNYPEMVMGLIRSVGGGERAIDFRIYDVQQGNYPGNPEDCQAYIITGSRKSVYDDEAWIRRLEDYVRTLHSLRIKTVGICFGHQLVAQALGGKVEAAACGWGVGIKESHILEKPAFMSNAPDSFNLLVSHQDQVTALPEGARLLARNNYCPHAMYQIDDHFLCFQGHPEFARGYSRALMEYRREILGDEIYQAGMESLSLETHERDTARWILDFIGE